MTVDLRHGDCLNILPTLDPGSVDAIVTDPPYGLEFMGRDWDGQVPGVPYWAQCWRVLKPGGHLLAFGGTRTWHRLAVAIEDARFEIRDTITWLYGSGFPKSLDVSKAIDKAAGVERDVIGVKRLDGNALVSTKDKGGTYGVGVGTAPPGDVPITAPATPEAVRWQGWGTSLKPASEPVIVARRPLSSTVAANVLEHGTGALNIDGCRVGGAWENQRAGKGAGRATANVNGSAYGKGVGGVVADPHPAGRWPANVVLSHADGCGDECAPGCPVAELDAQSGNRPGAVSNGSKTAEGMCGTGTFQIHAREQRPGYADQGGASRFFPTFRYQAKAPARERPKIDGKGWPTVKPLGLMKWLVRLVTPPGGLVLDPFAGTGATLQAARDEGFRAFGIERDPFAYELACQRLAQPQVAGPGPVQDALPFDESA